LAYDKKRASFYLTKNEGHASVSTVEYNGSTVLKDTVIYVSVINPILLLRPTDNNNPVRCPSLLPLTPTRPGTQEARPPVGRADQYYLVFCTLCIFTHASLRLQSACTLPRTNYP
jgi:hypothetical protein